MTIEQTMKADQYQSHELHDTFNKLCSTCFAENLLIKNECEVCEGKGYFLKTEWTADDEDYEVEKKCECSLE